MMPRRRSMSFAPATSAPRRNASTESLGFQHSAGGGGVSGRPCVALV
jgi:hypothetical protein